ncbi:choice-of-anchor D domain-containing protein [bacterium]|nr:choice-of-anchor D domain-containing protein [bacterium]
MKNIVVLLIIVLFSISCSSPGTEKAPNLSMNPSDLLEFQAVLISQTATENLKLTNIGEGDLEVYSIALLNQSKVDFKISSLQTSYGVNTTVESATYPVVLKKDEYINLKVVFEPTEEGLKETQIEFKTNVKGKETYNYAITSVGLFPEIDVQAGAEKNINTLTVKACPDGWPVVRASSKIDICNLGNAPLKITELNLQDNSGSFEIEEINLPVKIVNSGVEKRCVQGLSICHKTNPGETNRLTIVNNTSYDEYIVNLVSE